MAHHHLAGTGDNMDDETAAKWGVIDRLTTRKRLRSSLFDDGQQQLDGNNGDNNKRVIDVTKLGALERHVFIEKLIQRVELDNLHLLQKIRTRIDKVGIELPSIEVRYDNLHIQTECQVVRGKALPTLWNSFKSVFPDIGRIPGFKSRLSKITIINGVSGIIKPGRMTLLLGPPGCGKTTLLRALSGNLSKSLEVSGDISYNGYELTEFVPQKTSAYISQYDLHIGEMTVRETLDFSLCCQGVGSRAEILKELIRREKEAGVHPDPDVDVYMKATSVEGQKTTLQTDYILRILGLDTCADTLVGDVMSRGISGGEKRRLTTGEMIVGPTRALFMDEISNGLDSATTYQIVAFLQQLSHITDATILVSLLQPAPETFDLFDDVILMGEGKVVYHGPRSQVLEFFESCGFRCPERKGIPDFLQEVISRKDQAQYWHSNEDSYRHISIDAFSRKYRESSHGKKILDELSSPFPKSKSHKDAVTFTTYSFSKWELLKTCSSREFLIMKRNSFTYIFKSVQIAFNALVVMTLFLRTMMKVDLLHANYYMGALFYAVTVIVINGFPEIPLTVARLPIFYKHRDLSFYPTWVYVIPSAILKIPHSLLEAAIFTCLTYYVVGYTPEVGRFFGQLVILFLVHLASTSMYRFIASLCRNVIVGTAAGSLFVVYNFLFSGFLIPRTSIPDWLKWGFWACPSTYGEIAINVNEFLAPRWKKMLPSNITTGQEILSVRGLKFDEDFFWISLGALLGFTLLFNIGWTLALSFLHSTRSRPIISWETFSQLNKSIELDGFKQAEKQSRSSSVCIVPGSPETGSMVLPFVPLAVVFRNLQYYVDTPLAMKDHGVTQKKLQLLHDITGTFRPGVLTALMGVSGAGKTTLFDVIAGRKTGGAIEGEIHIGGFLKVQKTFARVSGYCEQTDIHSPQITVEESIMFSACLRLNPDIDSKTRSDFVKEVLETIELDGIKDALVGIPGVTGLSGEQRKRLTIAVELVANPSILFLDEPTTGLDARAAAIVMRAVKNVASTGRTIVCTIHQPSIDIFEAFDELLLLKSGGRMIYCGPLGLHSNNIIKYFEGISGVPKIQNNRNPATWMLEVTSVSSEASLGVDFADIYKNSSLYENNEELAKRLSIPSISAKPLEFPTHFAQDGWGQFKTCLWKQHWSYWRSPSYNLMRFVYVIITSIALGVVFWKQGKKIENQQNLLNVLGSLFCPTFFAGFINSSSVMRYVSTERSVVYRERFSGLYASWVYGLAQVTIEIPYICFQVVVLTVITYPMIGYYGSAYKVFWYVYSMVCSLLYCIYLGMMIIAVTPTYPLGVILLSACFSVFNLLSGLFIPQPQIPKWWIWLYYLNPTSWTVKGLLISQYGDIEQPILVFGKNSSVTEFLGDYFEFHHHQLPVVAAMLLLYPVVFACLFCFFISKLNFEKR